MELILKDIGMEIAVKYAVILVGKLAKWLLNHHHFPTRLQDKGAECEPVRPVPTRFASQLRMLRRFFTCEGLELFA